MLDEGKLYASLTPAPTALASTDLCRQVTEALEAATPALRAQFETVLADARALTLLRHRGLVTLRNLGGRLLPAEGEDPRPRGRGGDGSTNYAKAAPKSDKPTDNQISLLNRLRTERNSPELTAEQAGAFTRATISAEIDVWIKIPRPAREVRVSAPKAPVTELRDGIYRLGDDWYKVVHAVHGSGRQYAKKAVIHTDDEGNRSATFNFEGSGPLRKLTPEHRVGLEEARLFGELYGCCVKCGATLTDEDSMADMMGPYCSGRKGTAAKRAEALAYWA